MDGQRKGGRGPNASPSKKCHPTISVQAEALLDKLAEMGIYGRTKNEVAGRFIEQVLQTLVEPPRLPVPVVYAAPLTAAPRVADAAPTYPKPAPRRRRRGQA